jgi:hypothetical protein
MQHDTREQSPEASGDPMYYSNRDSDCNASSGRQRLSRESPLNVGWGNCVLNNISTCWVDTWLSPVASQSYRDMNNFVRKYLVKCCADTDKNILGHMVYIQRAKV